MAHKVEASALRFIPLMRGEKRPLETDWPNKGRSLEEALTDAPDGRVGFVTGQGILVLDMDTKNGDPDAELIEAGVELTDSYSVRTPSGGRHIYFAVTEDFGQSSPFIRCDIRCKGGFVVCPPSEGYEVICDAPIAPIPESLLTVLRRHNAPKPNPPLELPEGVSPEHIPAVLERVVARVQNINGQQEQSLNGSSYLAGRYAGAGFLDVEQAKRALIEKGLKFTDFDPKKPWSPGAIEAKVTRALGDGFEKPLVPPEAKSLIPDTRPTIKEARENLSREMSEAIDRGGNTLLHVDVGIGKTHAAIEAIGKLLDDNQDIRILYSVPSHNLALEIQERMARVGIEANVWHGMGRPDPAAPQFTMCRKFDEARLYQDTSYGMREVFAENVFGLAELCDACEFRDSCGKRRQDFGFSHSKVGIITHSLLATNPTDAACGVAANEFGEKIRRLPDLLVVDESIDNAFLEMLEIDPRNRPIDVYGQIENPDVIEYHMFGYDPSLRRPPQKPNKQFREAVEKAKARNAYGCAAALHFDPDERIHTSKAVPAVIGGDEPKLIRGKELKHDWGKIKLFLDATPDIGLLKASLGPDQRLEVKRIGAATPHVTTTWVYGRGLFAGTMAKGEFWRNRIRDLIEVEASRVASLLFVAPKRVIDAFVSDWEDIPENTDWAHFGALAGLDAFRDVSTILIVSHDIPPTPFVRSYCELSLPKIVEDRAENCSALNHPDPDVAAYTEDLVQRGLEQAIGRGRGVNRTSRTPLRVVVIGNVAPTRTDECLRLDDYLPHALDVLAARGIVIADSPGTKGYYPLVHALMPERFENVEAARTYFRSSGDRPYETLLGQTPSENWRRYALSVRRGRYSNEVLLDKQLDLEALLSRFNLMIKRKII